MASAPGTITAKPAVGPWWRVVLAAGVWIALYLLIEPFSQWIAYGLAALPRGSHLGDAVAFFDLNRSEAHYILCDCHDMGAVTRQILAQRVRTAARRVTFADVWAKLRGMLAR